MNAMNAGTAIRSEEGSILIELAVGLPLLLLITVYMTDYALWVQRAIQLQNAAIAGAAYGSIHGNTTDTTGMTAVANFNATGSLSPSAGVTVNASSFYSCTPGGAQVASTTSCSGAAPFQYVKVTTSSTVSSLIYLRGIPTSLTLPGSATYRVQGTP